MPHGYDGSFAADLQKVYEYIRAHGWAGPVELAPGVDATLVVGHETALRVLQNPVQFGPTPATRMASAYGVPGTPRPAVVQPPVKKEFWSSFLEIFRV